VVFGIVGVEAKVARDGDESPISGNEGKRTYALTNADVSM
jgi:hypothetical protein